MVSMGVMVPQAALPPASTLGVSPKEQSGTQATASTPKLTGRERSDPPMRPEGA